MLATIVRRVRTAAGIPLILSLCTGSFPLLAAEGPSDEATLVPLPAVESIETPPSGSNCLELLETDGGACEDYGRYDNYSGYDDWVEGEDFDCYETSDCHAHGHYWFRGDYLLWWTRGERLPPLITTSPAGTPLGVLGVETTTVLFGGTRVHEGSRSNFRVEMGYWVDCCETFGIEGDYFDLGQPAARFSRLSSGDPVLARPFFDVSTGSEASQVIAAPGVAVGDVSVEVPDYFASVGVRLRTNLFRYEPCGPTSYCGGDGYRSCGDDPYSDLRGYGSDARSFRLDLIGGYRHYKLSGNVTVVENLVATGPPLVVGTMFNIFDDFRTSNEFHGGDLGLVAKFNRGRWSLESLAKLALGNNHRRVIIDGSTAITVPGSATTFYTGGLLALPTNIGEYMDDRFVVIPEFGLELGYQLTPRLRAFFGYNYLYWASVVRTGDQIDRNVNSTQIPPGALVGEARPRFEFRNSAFWAQGMNFGLEARF